MCDLRERQLNWTKVTYIAHGAVRWMITTLFQLDINYLWFFQKITWDLFVLELASHPCYNLFLDLVSCLHAFIYRVLQVPKLFPQDIPNNTSILSHIICPKFKSHVHVLKRFGKVRCNFFCLRVGVQRGASVGERAQYQYVFQKHWWWANQYGSLQSWK